MILERRGFVKGIGEDADCDWFSDTIVDRRWMNVLSSRGETPILEGDRRGNDPRDDENSSSTDRAVKTERRDGVARIAIGLGVRV